MKTTWKTGSSPTDATPVVTERRTAPPPAETDDELVTRHAADVTAAVALQPIAPNTSIKTTWSTDAEHRHAVESDAGAVLQASFLTDHFFEVGESVDSHPVYPTA